MGWRYQIPVLVDMGFRVVAPDMMGYGGTVCWHPDLLESTWHGFYILEPCISAYRSYTEITEIWSLCHNIICHYRHDRWREVMPGTY